MKWEEQYAAELERHNTEMLRINSTHYAGWALIVLAGVGIVEWLLWPW